MENYLKKENEKERELLHRENQILGYQDSSPLEVDEELFDLSGDIMNDHEIMTTLMRLSRDAELDQVKKSIELWKQLGIQLHDVLGFDQFKPREEMTEEELMEENCVMIHPEQIPLFLFPAGFNTLGAGRLCQVYVHGENKEDIKPAFHSIHIAGIDHNITSGFYAHEIAHSQLISRPGVCIDRLNSEVIPILSEEIFANELDPTLTSNRNYRNLALKALYETIDCLMFPYYRYRDKMKYSQYVQSPLEAFNLANIYLEGDSEIKKEMIQYIQKIFDEEKSVEDLLDHYHSTYEEVPKKLELIKKPFKS